MYVQLATNDDAGNHLGSVVLIEIDDLITLEGPGLYDIDSDGPPADPCDECEYQAATTEHGPRLRIKDRTWPVSGYMRYTGNVCWDAAGLALADAVDLLNYLRGLKTWDCTEAEHGLYAKWHAGEDLTVADFERLGYIEGAARPASPVENT